MKIFNITISIEENPYDEPSTAEIAENLLAVFEDIAASRGCSIYNQEVTEDLG